MEDHHYYGNNNGISSNDNNNNSNNNNGNTDISTAVIHGGNIEFSKQELEGTMDIILDDLLRDTHAHNDTTQTCVHLSPDFNNHHTNNNYNNDLQAEMLSSPNNEEKSSENDESTQVVDQSNCNKRARREKGDNREAVRRYRDRLKAREAALQEEVSKLRASNQELLKRLKGETAMQDEIYMLKCLLVDIRGRIEGEIHSFRHLSPSSNNNKFSGAYKHYHVIQQRNNEHRCGVVGKHMQSGQMLYDDYGQHGSNRAEFDNVTRTTPTLPSQPNKFFNFKRDV